MYIVILSSWLNAMLVMNDVELIAYLVVLGIGCWMIELIVDC